MHGCSPDQKESDCIQSALDILGDKWSPLLIKELTNGAKTFSELELSLEGISPRTLSQRLDKLTCGQIIIKNCYCDHPPRYTYSLTEKGEGLKAILHSMAKWSSKYHDIRTEDHL